MIQNWIRGRNVVVAVLLAGISGQAIAQSKGVFLANEVTAHPNWGTLYRWNFNPDGSFGGENTYNGSYNLGGFPAGTRPIGTFDFNGDGWSDTVFQMPDAFGPGEDAIRIVFNWFNTFTGVVTVLDPFPSGREAIGVGDFDGDGAGDVLMTDGSGNLSVFLIEVGFWYREKGIVNLDSSMKSGVDRYAGFADADGDGMADVLIRPKKSRLAFWKSTGTNVIRDSKSRPVQFFVADLISSMGGQGLMTVLGTMDLDGDGHLDWIMRKWNPNKQQWSLMRALNDGTGAFPTSLQAELKKAFEKTPVGVGDF